MMETMDKTRYKTPAMEVIDLKTQGILCQSTKDYKYGGLDENDI